MTFWFVQGDAAARVDAVDEGRRRRSSGTQGVARGEMQMRRQRGRMKVIYYLSAKGEKTSFV